MSEKSFSFASLAPVSKAEAAAAAAGEPLGGVSAPAGAPVAAEASPAAGGPSEAMSGPTQAAAPAAVAAAVKATRPMKARPVFAGGLPVERIVPIKRHVLYDGVLWEEIPVRCPTAREVGAFFERLVELAITDPDAVLHFPIYGYHGGASVPREVIEFLHPDDAEAVALAADDFLPDQFRRFKALLERFSSPASGENTGPT